MMNDMTLASPRKVSRAPRRDTESCWRKVSGLRKYSPEPGEPVKYGSRWVAACLYIISGALGAFVVMYHSELPLIVSLVVVAAFAAVMILGLPFEWFSERYALVGLSLSLAAPLFLVKDVVL